MLCALALDIRLTTVADAQTSAGNNATQAESAGAVVLAADTKGTPDERADKMVQQMTQAEKISLLSGSGFTTHSVPRLGIPEFTMSDGPQGVRNGPGNINQGCAFPCGSALAATWDADLATAYGKAVGLEGRARGTHYQLGPGVNICRVPVNGRNFEYFGEDPYLASVIAARWCKGCSDQGVVPTIKHIAANNQETARNSGDSVVDERTLHEVYLPTFRRAVLEGGTIAVMCSYNRLNGSYTSNHDWLLNQVLKKEWGFNGIVMSDWGASHNVTDLAKGLDLEMPRGGNLNERNIPDALSAGTVRQSDIDNAVHRLLRTAFAMDWLEKGYQQKNSALPLDSDDSAQVALDVARAAIVLLKNEGALLPLDRNKIKSIVVLGPNATAGAEVNFGGAGGRGRGRGGFGGGGPGGPGGGPPDAAGTGPQLPANIGGGGSGAVRPFNTRFARADYLQGITRAAGDKVKVTYVPMPAQPATAEGAPPAEPVLPDMEPVKSADVAIICVGLNRGSESEGRDRAFDLPPLQQAIINAVTTANAHTIIINNSGAAVGMAKWHDKAAAVIQAWYLGQEGGIAIGETLFGDNNPSGRLCSTFDKTFEDCPAFANYPGAREADKNYPTVKYEEGVFVGYRGYDKAGKAPLYPFGYGLSYTTFAYSNMTAKREGASVKVGLDVKNTGQRAGADIVQIYVGEKGCPLPRPTRELKGFTKVRLGPGASKHVDLLLGPDAFSYWSPDKKNWVTDAEKTFTVEAAASQRDIKLKQDVTLN